MICRGGSRTSFEFTRSTATDIFSLIKRVSLLECNVIQQQYLVYLSCIIKGTAMTFRSPKIFPSYSAYLIASRRDFYISLRHVDCMSNTNRKKTVADVGNTAFKLSLAVFINGFHSNRLQFKIKHFIRPITLQTTRLFLFSKKKKEADPS